MSENNNNTNKTKKYCEQYAIHCCRPFRPHYFISSSVPTEGSRNAQNTQQNMVYPTNELHSSTIQSTLLLTNANHAQSLDIQIMNNSVGLADSLK